MTSERDLGAWLGDLRAPAKPERLTAALDALYGPGPGPEERRVALEGLRAALRAKAGGEVYYHRLAGTPLGTVYMAVSEAGLTAVGLAVDEAEFTARVARRTGSRPLPSAERVAATAQQVEDYLTGRRTRFSLPVDWRGVPEFQRRVLQATAQVPRGHVATYAEIAARIGRPRASRAVGQALAHNPMPIVIPCHRVVASDGSLTGYQGGGVRMKARLLALEGAALPAAVRREAQV